MSKNERYAGASGRDMLARVASLTHQTTRGGLLAALLLVGCGRPEPTRPAPTASENVLEDMSETTWLKGQLHMHTANSGDSETPPGQALRWYAERGFDFVVVTDHNFVTAPPAAPGLLVAAGAELTQNRDDCEPAPEPGLLCLLHVNALFVDPARAGRFVLPPPRSTGRQELLAQAVAASEALGGIAALNHPNFHYAADARLLTTLASEGLGLFELANAAIDSNNAGDADHPSTEAMWDLALGAGARLFATATDDAHHYDDAPAVWARGETAYVGDRGFVMVDAARDLGAIRAAIVRGDFYASTGVLLKALRREAGAITVEARAVSTIEFVGAGGAVLRTISGTQGRMALTETGGPYLRARIRAASGAMAWTQPIWRDSEQ